MSNNILHKSMGMLTYACSNLSFITHLGRDKMDDIFKYIFVNESVRFLNKISPNFVSKVHISNIPALLQLMACRRPGGKPSSEPMMVSLSTHIWVTRP